MPEYSIRWCIADEVFIATGARVFNGAQLGRASSVALGGTVHIGAVLPPLARVPIGWVALGEPAAMYPPGGPELLDEPLGGPGHVPRDVLAHDEHPGMP